jgi:hypothetical protein
MDRHRGQLGIVEGRALFQTAGRAAAGGAPGPTAMG